jgi:SNF2 family DNA or RNA helicase
VLKDELPAKYEYVLRVKMTPLQIALYEKYVSACATVDSAPDRLYEICMWLLVFTEAMGRGTLEIQNARKGDKSGSNYPVVNCRLG